MDSTTHATNKTDRNPDAYCRHSPRWHAVSDCGRTIIIYAPSLEEANELIAKAAFRSERFGLASFSGYYCHETNSIYEAQDGPTEYHDARRSF